MKKITFTYSLNLLTLLFISSIALAQVGINTTDPKGVLDFNSAILGVVYPNVSLLAADDQTPVVNPQGGALAAGTVVYNTNTTQTGANTDVFPGIYVWDGSEWIVHYKKRQSELHNQTAVLRTEANFLGGWQDIPGLGISDTKTFTAQYSGLYRMEVKSYFAGGRTGTNSSIFVSQASGQFRFLFNGTPYNFETSAFSAYSSYIAGGTNYEGIWKESYETKYVKLIAGQTYPFSLCFDAYDAPGFIGNGSTTAGGGPTSVDLVNEDFQSYADPVPQIFAPGFPDSDCGGGSTDGWETGTEFPCSGCVNTFLTIDSDNGNCSQNATALISFTPTLSTVGIDFDYLFRERSGRNDSFRVYLHDGTAQVGADLLYIDNSFSPTTDASYNGSHAVVPGVTHTLRFEYISDRARYASVDNVVISELSGPPSSPSTTGRGYVGNEVDCQIEFTYIGE
jgi:hypothetical protein